MDYTIDGLEYFYIEVDCEECRDGKYEVCDAYDPGTTEEVVCEFCEGTGRVLKPVPILGSEHRKKYLN